MTTSTIARPYAVAAFEAADASNQLMLWSQALKQLATAISDSQLKSLIKNPVCTKTQLSDILIGFLHTVCGNSSSQEQEPIANFIRLLAEKKRLALLADISTLFEEALAKKSGYLSLVVTSAFPMDDHQKNQTQERLAKKLNSKLHIVFNVDKKIIGGLLVRSGNWVLDDTVTGKLRRLKTVLS